MRYFWRIPLHLSVLAAVFFFSSVVPTEAGFRIMIFMTQQSDPYQEVRKGFQEYLNKQGITVEYDIRHFEGPIQEPGGVLQAIKEANPLLVLTLGSPATEAVMREIKDIPIIAGMIMNEAELTKGGNATGIVLEFPLNTQVSWIQQFLPHKKTIGALFNAQENTSTIEQARRIIEDAGLTFYAKKVDSPRDLPDALDSLSRRADVLWGLTDSVVLSPETAKGILLFSFRNRIPFIGLSTSWVKAGAVYALDRDYFDIGLQCGEYGNQVLKGVNIRTLKPQPPRKVLYALNLKSINHMKLNLPDGLIAGAHTIFE
ncbi:MAG: ABC transporter substrate-binding protein [Nitrospira sp.]|nr:ABC transporter substrate-binding protein [Nitrospira sp.]